MNTNEKKKSLAVQSTSKLHMYYIAMSIAFACDRVKAQEFADTAIDDLEDYSANGSELTNALVVNDLHTTESLAALNLVDVIDTNHDLFIGQE